MSGTPSAEGGAARGLFITIEGGEGSGKTGLAPRLMTHLEHLGFDTVRTREPGGCPQAEEIRSLVVSGGADRWSPEAELLLFMAARREHLNRVILPAVARGAVVVCDRFLDSTVAYQGMKGVAEDTILDAHRLLCDDVRPDLTLLLDLDPVVGLARAGKRLAAQSSTEGRFESMGLAWHQGVRAAFLHMAAREPQRFAVIDAARDQEAVIDAALAAVTDRLRDGVGAELAAIQAAARRALGGDEAARVWLRQPAYGLGFDIPERLLGTKEGRQRVLTALGQIEYGVYS